MQSHMSKFKNRKNMRSKTAPNPEWQELNPFLLSKVFTYLPPQDQLFTTPYICKSWFHATIHTLFPNSTLPLTPLDTLNPIQRLRFIHLLNLAVDRVDGWISISYPSQDQLPYLTAMHIAQKTPNMSSVYLPSYPSPTLYYVFISLMYWKNLRIFRGPISKIVPLDEGRLLLSQMADHCKGLVELGFHGELMETELVTIVEGLPLIKVLDMSCSRVEGKCLRVLLDGRLRCLKELNLMHCVFFDHDDDGEVADDEEDEDDYAIINEDDDKMKKFKEEVFDMIRGLKSLKKFLHCFHCKNCVKCKNEMLEISESTSRHDIQEL